MVYQVGFGIRLQLKNFKVGGIKCPKLPGSVTWSTRWVFVFVTKKYVDVPGLEVVR